MAEYIIKRQKDGKKRVIVKFHTQTKSFRRIEVLKHNGNFYNIYIDKNDSVYNVEKSEVVSWKGIKKGNRRMLVPNECVKTSEPTIINKVRGNPYKIALVRIVRELDKIDF